MARLPSRLRRLDDALLDIRGDEGAMLLSELDGYLTGVALSPKPVPPGEWLPRVWGPSGAAPFDDPADVEWLAGMVVARHAEIRRDLARGRPQPIYDVDERNGDLLWELWIEGFAAAMELRREGWAAIAPGDEADAVAGMTGLIAVATNESALTSIEINAVCDAAPGLIEKHLLALAGRLRDAAPLAAARPVKVGRNDPCPCGSGRKHKRCCALA